MLRLVYCRRADQYQYVTVYGEAKSIADLFWQLTRNYKARDGTEIGSIKVFNKEGRQVKEQDLLANPYGVDTLDCTLEKL